MTGIYLGQDLSDSLNYNTQESGCVTYAEGSLFLSLTSSPSLPTPSFPPLSETEESPGISQ